MTSSPLVSGVYAVIVLGGAILAGAALSAWRSSDVLDRGLVGIVAGACALVAPALLLAMFGALSTVPYVVLMLAIAVASGVWIARTRLAQRVPAAWSPAGAATLFVGLFLAALSLAPTFHGLPTGESDSRRYHIVNLITWAHGHSLWRLPFQTPGLFTATHPGNGELLPVGLLYATGRDQLVYTTFALFGAIAIVAAASIARDLGGRPDRGALTMLAFLATPQVYATQAHSLTTDLAAAAPVLAGIACVLRARHEHDARWVAAAGCALGFGIGAKYTVFWLVPLVVIGAIISIRPRRLCWWLVPGLAFFGAPWFVRNLVKTGDPIFPQGLAVGGHQILRAGKSPYLVYDTTMLSHVLHRHVAVLERWLHLLWHYWGPAPLLLIAGAVFAFVERPRHRDRMAIAVFAIVATIVYVVTPFTGAGPTGIAFLMGSNMRYLIPAALAGVTLAAVVVPSRVLAVVVGATFVYDAFMLLKGAGFRSDLDLHRTDVFAAVVVAALVCAAVFRLGRRTIRAEAVFGAGIVVLLLVVSASIAQANANATTPVLEKLVASTHARRVAIFGGADLRSVMGPDLKTELDNIVAGPRGADAMPRSMSALAHDVDASNVNVIVVGAGTPGLPSDWQPPPDQWTMVGTAPAGVVYERKHL